MQGLTVLVLLSAEAVQLIEMHDHIRKGDLLTIMYQTIARHKIN